MIPSKKYALVLEYNNKLKSKNDELHEEIKTIRERLNSVVNRCNIYQDKLSELENIDSQKLIGENIELKTIIKSKATSSSSTDKTENVTMLKLEIKKLQQRISDLKRDNIILKAYRLRFGPLELYEDDDFQ
ncbi:hypothetical protein [Ferrimonas balearica]|uniref:hypothetical protein n=1 Tax=Ferrimonas balearica TaxID=44012 RepID=UPI001C95EDB5|nr:hypothetical protein [Ferrimonas balearica]MBY5980891.1 hypothetical protein [Ferrimonas balearica]